MFRRALVAALLGILAVPAALAPARAQSTDPSFRVVNNTTDVVNEIYASPSSQRNWGPDRLGRDVIQPGANYIVRLPAGECVYDIRVVYQGGRSEERRNINTCNITDFVLGAQGSGQRTQAPRGAQQGNPSFNLVNQSGRIIEEFYASPTSQNTWGRDLLGDDVVQPGANFAIRLPVGECNYDIRVVFAGGQSSERRNVNTCEITNYVVN